MVLNKRADPLVSLAGCARGLKPAPYYIVADAQLGIRSIVEPRSNQKVFQALEVTEFLRELLMEGSLVEYYKRHKAFPWRELGAAESGGVARPAGCLGSQRPGEPSGPGPD